MAYMSRNFPLILSMLWCCLTQLPACAEETDISVSGRHLLIGTMHSPPFIIKNIDGTWSGLSVDLWRSIADELDLTFEFEEHNIQELLDGVHNGQLDVAAAALTITESREESMDFTHPFHTTGFAIATLPGKPANVWTSMFEQLFSWEFVQVVGLLFIVLLLVGWLMWIVEHNHREIREDGYRTIRHLEDGFWWAAATMTTVGYGDKAPVTRIGRMLGVAWMFTAIMLVASFIAAFTSILTVNKLAYTLNGPEDLIRSNVATVPASTSEEYLKRFGIASRSYNMVQDGLEAVASGKVDAMVYDAPLLKYLVKTKFAGRLEVLPITFERQDYGFALPAGSDLREPVNRALLRVIRSQAWEANIKRYVGN